MRKENTMEQHDSTEELVCAACRRVPVSHLNLDVAEPVQGWSQYFEEKGILVLADAAGRPSVARHVLADLIDEQREREARLAEEAAARAAELVQPVGVGVPAIEDADAFTSLMAAGATTPQEEFAFAPRPNFLVEELEAGSRHQAAQQAAVRRRKEKR